MITSDTLQKLEFTKVLQQISRSAHSEVTRREILSIVPYDTAGQIRCCFGQVEEIRTLSRLGVPFRLDIFEDIHPFLEILRPDDSILNPIDLQAFISPFSLLAAISRQFVPRQDIPLLKELAGAVTGFPEILEALVRTVDSDGGMLDTASKLLYEIRGKKRGLVSRIRRRLEEIVRERSVAIFLQDDFITQRSGRWVIPVRMDSKGMVPGVVHDVSNTGETAFMEPIEIIGLANELENLAAEEKSEQIRILREICGWLREDASGIVEEFNILIRLDLLNSIARFADRLGAEVPAISEGGSLRLVQARHPLLMLLQQERGGLPVVPLDLGLGDDPGGESLPNRIMVITGPNTGGKTIALKTAGLLTLMAMAGIPVPAQSGSVFPLAGNLLVDIGDEQAIESSLSTFSSHVSIISEILAKADERTFVLLDELGTGTEPLQGAALACAVLKDLHGRGAKVLATTHLTEIIGFVHRSDGMLNAAMEFDRQTLLPLYRLKEGEPGESHALETARRYGLPDHVVTHAEELLGSVGSEFHAYLTELKVQRQAYDDKLEELASREAALIDRERMQHALLTEAEELRRTSKEKGWLEAKELIQSTRRELNQILEEARREKHGDARKRLQEKERQVDETLRAISGELPLSVDEIREGSRVQVRSMGCDATVLKIDRRQGRLRVQAGSLELDVPLGDLTLPIGKTEKKRHKARTGMVVDEEAPREINLIGLRVEEALTLLEPFLNHASLACYGEVRVIHGIGTGALRTGVREHLERHPLVAGFRGGEQYEGGNGVTVATLL